MNPGVDGRTERAPRASAASEAPVPPLWTRDFLLICMVGLFTAIMMQILNATLAVYVDHLGGRGSFSGLVATVFAVCAGVMRLVSGRWSDVKGRRIVMVLGALVFGVGVYACGVFASLPLLLLFRAVQGVGFAAVSTASGAAVADVTPKSRMGEGLGYFGLGQSLSLAIGPAVGLAFTAKGEYPALFTTGAAVLALCLVFALFCTYEKRRPKPDAAVAPQAPALPEAVLPPDPQEEGGPAPRGLWTIVERTALPASLLQLLLCVGIASMTAFAGLFATTRGFAHAGLFFTFQAVAMFVSRLFAGRLFDRHGPYAVLVPATALAAATFAGLALLRSEGLFLACGAAIGLALGSIGPALQALAVRRAPHHRRGAAMASFFLATDIGIGLGSVLWGFVLDAGGFLSVFLGAAAMMAVTLAASAPAVRRALHS